jgi:predicted RNase H-like HicB family nuclease
VGSLFHARRRVVRFRVVLEPSDEGGYTVYVPSLPGCISEGDTVEDALANIQEALELYLEPVEDDRAVEMGLLVRELVL